MRFTPPVQTMYALKQAIDEYFDEGGDKRYLRYTKNWETLREGIEKLGFQLLLDSKDESRILLTVINPVNPKFDFEKIHDLLYDKNYTIYPGKVGTKKTFRLANMGAINSEDISKFLIEFKRILNKLGLNELIYN